METWLEPNRDRGVPSFDAVKAAWESGDRLIVAPANDERIERLLSALAATHVNGGALFASFLSPPDPVLGWDASRNRFEECQSIERFLTSPAFREALPALRVDALPKSAEFEWNTENAFALDGQLGALVFWGGAYEQFAGTAAEAKKLGNDFCAALFGTRYSEVAVYRSHRPWSPWFFDIAWDATWLIIDKRERRVSLLAVTDTD